ncbi:MAG: ABC transporter ATP-binding protein [Clostridium sp.]
MAILELKDISKTYGKKSILDKFSLQISEGEMVAITGVSGKGKSTILNILGLLDGFDSGTMVIDGESNIKPNSSKATRILREKISYLFQNFALIDEETVEYNLNLALRYVNANKGEKKVFIKDALEKVGLSNMEKSRVHELSGGEQQRVALARIMLKPSKIILADEPTGSLDEENLYLVVEILKSLNESGKTVVVVTHDKKVAEQCSRVVTI